jgi:hypothetical protein
MLGEHQLTTLAAALAIGAVLTLGGAAGAGEGPAIGPAPFQLKLPDGASHSLYHRAADIGRPTRMMLATLRPENPRDGAHGAAAASGGLFEFADKSHRDKPDGLLGFNDDGALAHAFADIPAAPKLMLTFGQSGVAQLEVAQLPIPGTVWLFLAALALLFGISRRQIANN